MDVIGVQKLILQQRALRKASFAAPSYA